MLYGALGSLGRSILGLLSVAAGVHRLPSTLSGGQKGTTPYPEREACGGVVDCFGDLSCRVVLV
jgi:hypothetical protein